MDLLPELEVERTLLGLALVKIGKEDSESSPTIKDTMLVNELANEITNTVAKIHQVRSKSSLTKDEVAWLMITLKQGIDRFVPGKNREAFFQWLKAQHLEELR